MTRDTRSLLSNHLHGNRSVDASRDAGALPRRNGLGAFFGVRSALMRPTYEYPYMGGKGLVFALVRGLLLAPLSKSERPGLLVVGH